MTDCDENEGRFVDFLADALPDAERTALEAHVAGCAACADTLRAYRAIEEAYRALPAEDVGEEIAGRMRAAAREPRAGARSSPTTRWWPTLGVAAAAAVALYFLFAWDPRPGDDRDAGRDPVDALVDRSAERRRDGDLAAAADLLDRALDADAGGQRTPGLLHDLGALYLELGDAERAFEHLDRLSEAHPDYVRRKAALLLRGEALEARGEIGQAIQAYQLLAAEFPDQRDEAARRVDELEVALEGPRAALMGLGYLGEE